MVYLKFVRHKDIQKLLDTSEMADLAAESLGLKKQKGRTLVPPSGLYSLEDNLFPSTVITTGMLVPSGNVSD
jgi:hypothetical protein